MIALDVVDADVAALGPADLRNLVGRLCEATLTQAGLPRSSATWSGSQDAGDGGIDVRVAVPQQIQPLDYLVRANTGFQVKKPDLGPAAIEKEMRPNGRLRASISDLAARGGAYILVTAASLSDTMWKTRLKGMQEAAADDPNASRLALDIYDAGRIASWIRNHPTVAAWLRMRLGRPIQGWRSYCNWSAGPEGADQKFVSDGAARVREVGALVNTRLDEGVPMLDGIARIRSALRGPGKAVRLVGLSGVGKTRFAQALFEDGVGAEALDEFSVLYTDLAHDPEPKPIAMATQAATAGEHLVLVVDNCPPSLHDDLSRICHVPGSTLSVLTIEYDIRDDIPDGTEAFILEAATPEFVEKLVAHRFPTMSAVDAETAGVFSGGNARVGLALAHTVGRTESLAGLSNEALFLRLFEQRHAPDAGLLTGAEACALVYSFDGDMTGAADSEMEVIAELAGCNVTILYRHVSELADRGLVQSRARWRAVLPHAIANRLAGRALKHIPNSLLDRNMGPSGHLRLFSSFCRRLGYLHAEPAAASLVERWLDSSGELGDVASLDDTLMTSVRNLAPANLEAALSWAERAVAAKPESLMSEAGRTRDDFVHLVRKLAYEPRHFGRCIAVLTTLSADAVTVGAAGPETSSVLASTFSPFLSGTQASIEERMAVARSLLLSPTPLTSELGFAAMEAALEAAHFSSSMTFDFGARSRGYGYEPRTRAQQTEWYTAVLHLALEVADLDGPLAPRMRALIARKLPDLWVNTATKDLLESAARRYAGQGLWLDGWLALRRARELLGSEKEGGKAHERLDRLCEFLAPSNLHGRIEAHVLHEQSWTFDAEDSQEGIQSAMVRGEALAFELGRCAVEEDGVLTMVMPLLVVDGGGRRFCFARGVAHSAPEPHAMWQRLVAAFASAGEKAAPAVLCGYLATWKSFDGQAVETLLDAAVDDVTLGPFFPTIEVGAGIGPNATGRLRRSLAGRLAPLWRFGGLKSGVIADIAAKDLASIIFDIAEKPNGLELASELLAMRFHIGVKDQHDRACLAEVGAALLKLITWHELHTTRMDHALSVIAASCLSEHRMIEAAKVVCQLLAAACKENSLMLHHYPMLFAALFKAQLHTALDAFVSGDTVVRGHKFGIGNMFDDAVSFRPHPVLGIADEDILQWCQFKPGKNHVALASFVPLIGKGKHSDDPEWSSIATKMLRQTPEPEAVIASFAARLRPSSWSGSRAALLERNARFLDRLKPHAPQCSEVLDYWRSQILAEAQTWKVEEDRSSRDRHERFEA